MARGGEAPFWVSAEAAVTTLRGGRQRSERHGHSRSPPDDHTPRLALERGLVTR